MVNLLLLIWKLLRSPYTLFIQLSSPTQTTISIIWMRQIYTGKPDLTEHLHLKRLLMVRNRRLALQLISVAILLDLISFLSGLLIQLRNLDASLSDPVILQQKLAVMRVFSFLPSAISSDASVRSD